MSYEKKDPMEMAKMTFSSPIERIKIGQIVFAKMKLESWKIEECETGYSIKSSEIEMYTKRKFDNILFAVKYLGQGVIEEMSTKENIFVNEQNGIFEDSEGLTKMNNYNITIENGEEITDYIERLEKAKQLCFTNNLLCTSFKSFESPSEFFTINEYTKNEYLKHSDVERSDYISNSTISIIAYVPENTKIIDSLIKNPNKVLYTEMSDMANLENALFDFGGENNKQKKR